MESRVSEVRAKKMAALGHDVSLMGDIELEIATPFDAAMLLLLSLLALATSIIVHTG